VIRLLLILLTLVAFEVRAAALDFVVRRNNANTDTYPDAASDLVLLWDTAVDSTGSGIVYSAGTFTLGETGHFLVMVSDRASSTQTNRIGGKITLNLGGTELRPGYSTFWRRGADGHNSSIAMSVAIIDVTSTAGSADDLIIRAERSDNQSPTPTYDRVATESGISIIKLDDTHNYARYEGSAFNGSTTDNVRIVADLDTTLEEDSPFSRTGNVIDIATTNTVLAIITMQFVETTGGTARHEYQSNAELNGTPILGSWNQHYIRYDQDTDWESKTTMFLIYPASGDDLDLGVITRETGEAKGWLASLQLWELPSGATTCTLEATTGDFNLNGALFVWDTVKSDTSADFTCIAADGNIEAEFAGEAILMSGQAYTQNTAEAGTRAAPGSKFGILVTPTEQAGAGCYNRADATAGHCALSQATLQTGISANDRLRAFNIRLSAVTTSIENEEGAFSAINLASLVAAEAARRRTSLVNPD